MAETAQDSAAASSFMPDNLQKQEILLFVSSERGSTQELMLVWDETIRCLPRLTE